MKPAGFKSVVGKLFSHLVEVNGSSAEVAEQPQAVRAKSNKGVS
jgi:hypothetical protein